MSAAASASADWGSGRKRAEEREPYVLVHGAWHGGWCWGKVAERLQAAGHSVFTPTLTGLGDRAHLIAPNVGLQTFVEDVVSTIDMEDLSDLVLVGHSFGDAVIGGVTDARPDRIGRLVFLDSFCCNRANRFQPASFREVARKSSAIKTRGLYGETLVMPPPPPSVFGVTDPKDTAWVARRLKPHPIKTYEDTLELKRPLGAGHPKTYIACTNQNYRANEPLRRWVQAEP
jgi:pimeloyl-ACP methyl ester carboxylesterase